MARFVGTKEGKIINLDHVATVTCIDRGDGVTMYECDDADGEFMGTVYQDLTADPVVWADTTKSYLVEFVYTIDADDRDAPREMVEYRYPVLGWRLNAGAAEPIGPCNLSVHRATNTVWFIEFATGIYAPVDSPEECVGSLDEAREYARREIEEREGE